MPRNKFKDRLIHFYLEKCGYVCGWSQIILPAYVTQMYIFLDILSNSHNCHSITYLVAVSPRSLSQITLVRISNISSICQEIKTDSKRVIRHLFKLHSWVDSHCWHSTHACPFSRICALNNVLIFIKFECSQVFRKETEVTCWTRVPWWAGYVCFIQGRLGFCCLSWKEKRSYRNDKNGKIVFN